ncbi:MAG: tetratricopeptide repeat protein [Candidatus Omnitrophota bacterium]|nr:tetratricopeptide repeat protein [Candidatus Omnitrophota bacterium]
MAGKGFQGIKSVFLLFSCISAGSIFMLTCDVCLADTLSQARAKFYHANTCYSEAEYDKAIKAYEEALSSGFESGNLYYNLGNSHFKKGEFGKAILNYQKAMRLIPRDSDLKSNYKYAKSLIKGNVVEAKTQSCGIVFDRIFSLFTIDGLAFSLAVIFTGILLIILLTVYISSIRKYRIGALSVLIIIFTLFFMALFEKASAVGKEAIIIIQKADAKFEPFDSATAHFTLYEGAKVAIVSPKDSWCKIERSDKKTGWVKKSDLEIF